MPLLPAHPKLRALLDLWDRKRGPRLMPARRDIDVTELSSWLGHLHLVEIVDDGRDFRHRIYGTEIAALFGMDLTGKGMDAVPEPARSQLLREYRQVQRSGAPLLVDHDPLVQSSLESIERLVLPLSSDGRSVDRLLIGAFPARKAGAVPPLSERRLARRIAARLEAVVDVGGRRCPGTVLDYSSAGVRLRLDQPLPGGDPLALVIDGNAALAARLVWQRDGEAGFHFIGAPRAAAG